MTFCRIKLYLFRVQTHSLSSLLVTSRTFCRTVLEWRERWKPYGIGDVRGADRVETVKAGAIIFNQPIWSDRRTGRPVLDQSITYRSREDFIHNTMPVSRVEQIACWRIIVMFDLLLKKQRSDRFFVIVRLITAMAPSIADDNQWPVRLASG